MLRRGFVGAAERFLARRQSAGNAQSLSHWVTMKLSDLVRIDIGSIAPRCFVLTRIRPVSFASFNRLVAQSSSITGNRHECFRRESDTRIV